LLYGLHTVEAALANPNRPIHRLLATPNAARRLQPVLDARGLVPEATTPKALDRLLGAETVHQGVTLKTDPLPPLGLEDLPADGLVLVLDQVTDPQNVGAVLRSAAAFGARALVMTERHSPAFSGALAKAASGALDVVPVILVRNLAKSLTELGERGFFRLGLAEAGAALRALGSWVRTEVLVPLWNGVNGLRRWVTDRLGELVSGLAALGSWVRDVALPALWGEVLSMGRFLAGRVMFVVLLVEGAVEIFLVIKREGTAGLLALLLPGKIGLHFRRMTNASGREGRDMLAAMDDWADVWLR
ncbi:hypothetical protein LCGC14_1961440, partial [marine sediment metagenome]